MRRWRVFWLAGALPAMVLLLATLWLAASPAALDWLAGTLAARSDNALRVERLSGSLLGPLRAGRIVWQGPNRSIEVEEVELTWSPLRLLSGRVWIDRLTARRLHVSGPGDATPPALPEQIAPPLPVSIGQLALDTLEIDAQPLAHDILLTLRGDAVRWRIEQLSLRLTPPVAAASAFTLTAAGAELAVAAPHALTAEATLAGRFRDQDLSLSVHASGTLAATELDLALAAGAAKGTGHAQLAPFAAQPLNSASLTLDELDPRQWHEQAPQARLTAQLALQTDRTGALVGDFSLHNAAPGLLARRQAPVTDLRGTLAWDGSRLRLADLRVDLLADSSVDSAGPLTGSVDIVRAGHAWQLNGKVGAGKTALTKTHADFALHLDAERLRIERLQLAAAGAQLAATGTLGIAGARPLSLTGRLAGIDPSRFGDYPSARLGGEFSLNGHLAPAATGRLVFTLADSRFRDAPLAGRGQVEFSAGQLGAAEVDLRLAENHLQAKGRLGAPTDRLHWRLNAPRLAALLPTLSGQLRGEGTLVGSVENPAIQFALKASNLAIDKGLQIAAASVTFDGHRDRHRIEATARVSGSDLSATLAGGLSAPVVPLAWQGQLLKLTTSGRYAVALQTPAELFLSRDRQRITGAQLALAPGPGILRLNDLDHDGARLRSDGALQGLPLRRLLPETVAAQLTSTLTLGGEWQLALDRQLTGQARLWREQGDLQPRLEHAPALGLSRLEAKLRADAGRIELSAGAAADKVGHARLDASLGFARGEHGWGVPAQAPLTLQASADLPDLAWLGRLWPQLRLETAGAVQLEARASGTAQQPQLSGSLAGNGLALRLDEQGVNLKDGMLRASFDGDRLNLKELRLKGGDGSVRATGALPFVGPDPALTLDIVFDRLQALSRPDRLLVLDGTARATLQRSRVAVDGKLQVVRGLFLLPENDGLTLSDDVTVLGRKAPLPSTQERVLGVVDLQLDLGDNFRLGGRGVEARLAGALRLHAATDASPSVHGSVRLVDGLYTAYGQKLQIERGVLTFIGPLENPGLDILALRKNLPVEAGVAISGTVLAPQAKLTSTPWVPDADKLSWLVLGHGLDAGGKTDLPLLAAAASSLLGGGQAVALQTRMAHAFGLDDLSLTSAGTPGTGLEGTVLTLGKRLSSDARISFEQALTGTGTVARLHYQLTKHLSVRTSAGSDNAADLFYSWSFD